MKKIAIAGLVCVLAATVTLSNAQEASQTTTQHTEHSSSVQESKTQETPKSTVQQSSSMLESKTQTTTHQANTIPGMPEGMKMPEPTKEHAWLQQFVGEWDSDCQAFMAPGQPPITSKATETVKAVGKFWTLSEIKGNMLGQEFNGYMQLGYDPEKKQYIGTWVDSMMPILWTYEGTVDSTGKILTLESRGPCPMMGGKVTDFKETVELKDANHKVFTSQMKDENGKWVTNLIVNSTRRQ